MNFLKPLLASSFVLQCFHFHVLFFPSFNFLYHSGSVEHLTKSIFIPPRYSSLGFKDNLGLAIRTDCRSGSSLLHPISASVVVIADYVLGSDLREKGNLVLHQQMVLLCLQHIVSPPSKRSEKTYALHENDTILKGVNGHQSCNTSGFY